LDYRNTTTIAVYQLNTSKCKY